MNTKEQKEKIVERFDRIKNLMPDTIKALHQLPDTGDLFTHLDPGKLRVILDYDITRYKKYRREMGKDWKFVNHHFNEYSGCYHTSFKHKIYEVKFMIDHRLSNKGQTCRKVIDHYQNAEPVYKVECK